MSGSHGVEKESLISRIISIEWKMFGNVQNIGGRASCQEDQRTFEIMRHSQAESWSKDTLESYLKDLIEADGSGRNLMTEKYARMMASTSPLEYRNIKDHLPMVPSEGYDSIETIIRQVLIWEKEVIRKYPNVRKRGRPLYSSQDSFHTTSLETYLRGELSTFSMKTIKLYHQDIEKYAAENQNMSEIILENTMKKYGFKSLAAADEQLKSDLS